MKSHGRHDLPEAGKAGSRTPDASTAGCMSTYQAGETGVVYVTERDGSGERSAGGFP